MGRNLNFNLAGEFMEIKKQDNLSTQVLESIQQSIRDGEFKPGCLLPSEREMSERYGVGKSSIREAIKMLQVLGVVSSAQGKGTYLREAIGPEILRPVMLDMMLQQSTAEELYEFRVMFDTASIRLASLKATAKEKADAEEALENYRIQQATYSDTADYWDCEFHRIVLEATHNQFIIKTGALIAELCRPYVKKSTETANDTVMENHEKLLKIFKTGSTDGLDDAVRKSLLVFRNTLDSEYKGKSC